VIAPLSRRLAASRARSKGPRLARRPKIPLDVAASYVRALEKINRELRIATRSFLAPWIEQTREEQRDDADLDFGLLRVRLERIAKRGARDIVDQFGDRIAKWNLADLGEVLKIDLDAEPPAVRRLLERWRAENVDLIESIATRLHGDVRDIVRDATRKGTRVETVSRQIAERFDVSRSRANLIARDQVLKANADLTRERCSEAGVRRYRWSTSHDERVRGTPGGKWPKGLHYALDGREFTFDDPPIVNPNGDRGMPGTDFSCRCVAIPILED
jgi:SPP1 gp7 family putative phage head morphogenesis protein